MAITKIDVSTITFGGFARVLMFPNVDPETFTEKTTLAEVLAGGKDLGQLVEGSYSWTGDAASVETVNDTEGGVIRATPTAGTLGWECRVASTSSAMAKAIAGGKITKATTAENGDVKIDTSKDIIGLDPTAMISNCPIGVLDDTHKKLMLFPNSTNTVSPTFEDSMLELTLGATASKIETDVLSTMMIIPLAEDPVDGISVAA
jgi:hypothetical protein